MASNAPAAPPRENLIRALPGISLVREEGDTMPTLTGHAAVFNTWTTINSRMEGHFLERFAPGAFAKTISERGDKIKVLFNHGQDPSVGDKVLGPIRSLEEDEAGLRYEVPLLDTSYNRDLIPGLDAGLYGASFRFSVMREDRNDRPKRTEDNPDGIPERTVAEARLAEFGPVTFPAYPTATAGLRSLTDEFVMARFLDDPDRLAQLIEALKPRATTSVFISDGRNWQRKSDTEPDPPEDTTPPNNDRNDEPDPPEDTTPDAEPEPSEATTHSDSRSLFWFAEDPTKGAK